MYGLHGLILQMFGFLVVTHDMFSISVLCFLFLESKIWQLKEWFDKISMKLLLRSHERILGCLISAWPFQGRNYLLIVKRPSSI